MAPPRASRRKVVTISSDEDDNASEAIPSEPSEDEEPAKPQKRSTGKLKSAKKGSKTQQPTPTTSIQEKSSQKSPAKSKSKSKDPPKPNGRPIYSFFNATTDKQRTSQPSASPEKASTPLEQLETIQDDIDDDDESSLQFAKGSSTAQAMRKRKVQHGDSFESEGGLPPASTQKFFKTPSGDRVPSFSVLNDDKRPWTEQFAPNDLSDLAVHKRKVSDVQQWLDMALAGRHQRVLVLKGAAGTGKTTTVRLLAQHFGLQILEWKNPAGAELTAEGSASGSVQFAEFVTRAGRAGGLTFSKDDDDLQKDLAKMNSDPALEDDAGKLLLIEEFPNTFSRTSSTLQSFRSAISQHLSSPSVAQVRPTLIVMVVSETLLSTNTALADSFTAHRLLGPDLINHPYLDTIEFNAVAPTILTKALEAIVVKEARKSGRRKTPGPQVLKHLAESGDIRGAISSLEFLCLRGDDGDTWSSRVAFTKQKKPKTEPPLTKSEEEALKLISNRESTLGIFHAVGKVMYNKRIAVQSIEHPPPWLPHHRREKVPENDIERLIDELGTDTSTFVAALHENYALSCSGTGTEETMDSVLGCMESISDADLLSVDRFSYGTRAFSGSATDGLRQDEMCFQVAVRGLLFSLPFPVHRTMPSDGKRGDAHRMFYPSSLKLWRKREEIEGILTLLTSRFQAGTITSAANSSTEKSGPESRGVETWKTNSNLNSEQLDTESNDLQSTRTTSAKIEMLTERLPYISQIKKSSTSLSSKVIDQLNTVTRIRGAIPVEDDDEADADEDGETGPEQWATDRPDAEALSRPAFGKQRLKQSQKKMTEGGGLGLPVENSVEKLVLEDDDIVDD